MDYIGIEKQLADAKARFKSAFDGIENAQIIKSQYNRFALRFKYPLFIFLCLLVIAALIVVQVVLSQFDPLYIVCECIIIAALTAFMALLAVSWKINLQNSVCTEMMEYYAGEEKCIYSQIAGGNSKVEWQAARFFFTKKGEAELFEGGEKQYSPYVYKKIRGHARNFVLLSSDALISNFFDGAEVLCDDGETVALSSGFRFTIKGGVLERFEIDGMYSECYENNFPLFAPLASSGSYTFVYEFRDVNAKGYAMILPEIVRTACDYYFIKLPRDPNILVEDLKK